MASTGTISKDFFLLCIKAKLSVIEKLPEEILLKIYTYLGLKDLGRCLQVSKMFRKISKDKKLWQRITLFRKEVPIEFIGQALTFGLKHLSVQACNLKPMLANIYIDLPMILDLYPKKNELKSLVLDDDVQYRKNHRHRFTEHVQYFTTLLESCHSLEKLHFGGFYSHFNFPKYIAQNGQTLMVLNLLNHHVRFENHPGSVQLIIEHCTELKELALCPLGSANFATVCKKLTPKIRKLRIQTYSDNRTENDKYVEILTKRCHDLTVFSLDAVVTNTSYNNIVNNLSLTLEKLSFPTKLQNQEDMVEILELRSMSKLELLCLSGWIKDEEIKQKFFELYLPHLKVMFVGMVGNTIDVMGIAVQEGKKQKSKLDLFRDFSPYS